MGSWGENCWEDEVSYKKVSKDVILKNPYKYIERDNLLDN